MDPRVAMGMYRYVSICICIPLCMGMYRYVSICIGYSYPMPLCLRETIARGRETIGTHS